MKKNPFSGLSKYLLLFILGVGLIAVYKTFDNFNIILLALRQLISVATPFIIGLAIAFLLFKPVSFLEKQFGKVRLRVVSGHARIFAVTIVYLVVLVLLTLIVLLGMPALIKGLADFFSTIPAYVREFLDWLTPVVADLKLDIDLNATKVLDSLYKIIQPYLNPENVINSILGVVNVASALLNIVIGFIVSIYMLLGRESLVRISVIFLELFIPKRGMRLIKHYTKESCKILYTYFYSQVLDALLIAALMVLGLWFLGVKNAIIIGLIVGAVNIIPYFGAIVSAVVVVVMQLLSPDGGVMKAVLVGAYMLLIQQLDANVFQPRIIGTSVGIRPIFVLLAITLGGGFFGFLGIFLGVPFFAILQLMLRDYLTYREQLTREQKAAADGPPPDGDPPAPEENPEPPPDGEP